MANVAIGPSDLERTSSTSTTKARSRRRAILEFLLVGGLTPFLFPLSWVLRKKFGIDRPEYAVGFLTFYGAWLINDPHFSVTYLLFYKSAKTRFFSDDFDAKQRARYIAAGLVAPLVLGGWAILALGLKSAPLLGYLIQLMFFLVGWHYVKQGFGIFTVLSARRGVRYSPRERLAILAHCYLGWAYAWASPADRGTEVEEKGVVYWTIPHSLFLERLTFALFLGSFVILAFVLGRKRVKEKAPVFISPLVALLMSIWSWSIYSSWDPLVRYVIPALHSIQYLYFVWMMKTNHARDRERAPHFERSAAVRVGMLAVSALVLGWILFHWGPTLLDDALVNRKKAMFTDLGPTPYFAAIYAFVNIHHYAMDAVIWRRDNPETRYLTQDVAANTGAE